MKIKILGFHWKMFGNSTLADLRSALDADATVRLAQLTKLLTTGNPSGWDGTVFSIVNVGPYWVGVVLKVRDQKQFCQVSGSTGVIRLSAQALAAGSKMAEVNFFLVNPVTGKGLYQYYHLSTWPMSFGYLCKSILDRQVLHRCRELEDIASQSLWTPARLKQEKKLVQGTMTPELIIRKEGFDKLIDSLSNIDLVRVSIRDDTIVVNEMAQLCSAARNMKIELTFGKDSKLDVLKKALKNVVDKLNPRRMRVEGRTADGHSEIVNLIENPDAFDEVDFDAITAGLDLDLTNPTASLHASSTIQKLIQIASKARLKTMLNTP